MSIRPLDDRVVIERLEAEEKTAGGIPLPDSRFFLKEDLHYRKWLKQKG